MKAILVIDQMPKNCAECKLMYLQGIGVGICNAVDWDERPSWCPLKPLPNAINERGKWISEEYQKGWNAYRENLEK